MSIRVETETGAVIGMLIQRKINRGGEWVELGWIFSPWVSNRRPTQIPRPTALEALPRWVKKNEYTLVEIFHGE